MCVCVCVCVLLQAVVRPADPSAVSPSADLYMDSNSSNQHSSIHHGSSNSNMAPSSNVAEAVTAVQATDVQVTAAQVTAAGVTAAGVTDAGVTDARVTAAGATDAQGTAAGATGAPHAGTRPHAWPPSWLLHSSLALFLRRAPWLVGSCAVQGMADPSGASADTARQRGADAGSAHGPIAFAHHPDVASPQGGGVPVPALYRPQQMFLPDPVTLGVMGEGVPYLCLQQMPQPAASQVCVSACARVHACVFFMYTEW